MPSSSSKQHRFMEAVAHNPAFAKKVGISQSVGKEFSAADKGRKFEKGGATMMNKKVPMKSGSKGGMPPAAMAAMMARRRPPMGADMPPSAPPVMPPQSPAPMGMKKGGMPMKDGKPAFMMGKKMNMGGMAGYAKGGGIESRGKTKGTVVRMASGGSVSARADGIASKGKTKFRSC